MISKLLKYKKEFAKIQELRGKLALTDYQAIKFAEGELTAEEYEPIKEQRKQWRQQINELQEKINLDN